MLRQAENNQQQLGGMSYIEGTGLTLSQFVNQAFDLEIKVYALLVVGIYLGLTPLLFIIQ